MQGRRVRVGTSVAIGLAMVVATSGCRTGVQEQVDALIAARADAGLLTPEPAAPLGPGWTVMVYSMADTNLEPDMMVDVEELAGVGSQGDLKIEALIDRSSGYSAEPLLDAGDWSGARTYSVVPGGLQLREDLGDVDTADPATLAAFISASIAASPAEHYALVISDHGGGWTGVGADESAGITTLDIDGVRQGVADGLAAAGVSSLDLLGFDACLMATWETASTMASVARRMVASEELEPGHGWDYGSFGVLADPATDVDALGRSLVDGFHAQADAEGTVDQTTLSLLDLEQMPALDQAMQGLADAVAGRARELAPALGRAGDTSLAFGSDPDPARAVNQVDLGQLAGEISVQALDAAPAADAVSRALGDVVIYQQDGRAYLGATGMSVYFPPAEDYFDPAYDGLAGTGTWGQVLASYYQAGRDIGSGDLIAFDERAGLDVAFTDYGLELTAAIPESAVANVAGAEMVYGFEQTDGSLLLTGREEGTVDDDGTVSGAYDLTRFTITDGQDTMEAYLQLVADEESGLATIFVPMEYEAPGGGGDSSSLRLAITFDPTEGVVTSEAFYQTQADGDVIGEFTPAPDGLVFPLLYLVNTPDDSDGWFRSFGPGLYADLPNLQYNFDRLRSGIEMWAGLSVADYANNVVTQGDFVVIP